MSKDYSKAVSAAIHQGVRFDIDFHAQSKGEVLAELAKEFGYRKPRDANGSTGRYFFQRLQRQYEQDRNR